MFSSCPCSDVVSIALIHALRLLLCVVMGATNVTKKAIVKSAQRRGRMELWKKTKRTYGDAARVDVAHYDGGMQSNEATAVGPPCLARAAGFVGLGLVC